MPSRGSLQHEWTPPSITRLLSEGTPRIVPDLSSTSLIDSAGRRVLAGCARAVRASGATLVLEAARNHVRELFRRSDAQRDAQERHNLELVTDTDELARQRDKLETDMESRVRGTFIERTAIGHPLVRLLPVRHPRAHRWR